MTRQKNIFIGFSILLLTVVACNFVAPQAEPTSAPAEPTQSVVFTLEPQPTQNSNVPPLAEAEVPRISVEEAKIAYDSGEAVIVDVRAPDAYKDVHIAGAVSISLGEFEYNIANVPLDKDKWIITYCT